MMSDFNEELSIGYLGDAELADVLDGLDDADGAARLREAGVRGQGLARLHNMPWSHTSHVFGYVEERGSDTDADMLVPILPAAKAKTDETLIGSQVKVTLDAFQLQEYPGFSPHKVLFDFQGRDQAGGEAQDLQFASVISVNNHDRASINGMPIFTGLTVPRDGLSFKVKTIRIGSGSDEALLEVFGSSAFKEGLKLMGTLQPALPQLVGLASGITKNILGRMRNHQIQAFDLGLDFADNQTSIRLRRGSYVVVQVPGASMWRWDDWRFDRNTMSVVDLDGNKAPYNVIVFGVAESGSSEARSASRKEGIDALAASRGPA
ncbi:hypothetical protein [Sphingomonas sp. RIT328]|uniref:hypothetical protein n=1 Tax=Sphingomonas sp. RIT328 TaxID=1470591 RepID=UPI000452B39D|nr:hypothetical protein [Sphingomonas sp. RIT328]EZP52689.1 hypothetical protein BW41_02452 [Sphingomonas sp. RIT328]